MLRANVKCIIAPGMRHGIASPMSSKSQTLPFPKFQLVLEGKTIRARDPN